MTKRVFVTTMVLIMLTALPLAAAYEAHVIGVKVIVSLPRLFTRYVEGPQEVPVGTYQEWVFTYRILNSYDLPVTDLRAQDNFITGLDAALISVSDGEYAQITNPNENKQRFVWRLPSMNRRTQAVLKLKVSTGLKKDKQMFIKAGEHTLSNGATLTWTDASGAKQTTSTPAFKVVAK